MSISKYQMFLKTAACGNFSKAAEAMNFTQSGVSHAVQSLEEELGVTLLSRNRGGVVLTADGRALLPQIEELAEPLVRKAGYTSGPLTHRVVAVLAEQLGFTILHTDDLPSSTRTVIAQQWALPQAQYTAQGAALPYILINADGRYFVGDREVLRTDVESLKQTLRDVAGEDRERIVLIRADARTPWQAVVTTYEALAQLGFHKVANATAPAANTQGATPSGVTP